jgi:ABC-type oligopeptide transport system ATPase subunit
MLFISHDLSVVKVLCDRIAVLSKGKLVELANSEELFTNPKQEYTRELLSAIPVPDPQLARR